MDNSEKGILVVDDEPAVLQIVREFLQKAGHSMIFSAPSALAARKVWAEESKKIKLVITDLVLPDGRGTLLARDFLHEIRNCRAIMMTGYSPDYVVLGGELYVLVVMLLNKFTGPSLYR